LKENAKIKKKKREKESIKKKTECTEEHIVE